jgi:hypothetical protein
MVRVGPEQYAWALERPHVRPLLMGGKAPIGYVCVDPAGYASERELKEWIGRGIGFVSTLS